MKFIATKNDHNRILLKFLINILNNVPISKIYKMIRKKDIKINGKRVHDSKYRVQEGDEIFVYGIGNAFKKIEENTTPINFDVNFEDENILVVEKPIGVAMHDGFHSLDNQVKQYLKFAQVDSFKVSHISRLDKGTSGLVIYAKNYATLVMMTKNIREFKKDYEFVSNYSKSGTIKMKLKYDTASGKIKENRFGALAITIFKINKNNKTATLVTGKKHQIRATLAGLGFPILGDTKYGGNKSKRIHLHSKSITINGMTDHLKYLNKRTFKSIVKLH